MDHDQEINNVEFLPAINDLEIESRNCSCSHISFNLEILLEKSIKV